MGVTVTVSDKNWETSAHNMFHIVTISCAMLCIGDFFILIDPYDLLFLFMHLHIYFNMIDNVSEFTHYLWITLKTYALN